MKNSLPPCLPYQIKTSPVYSLLLLPSRVLTRETTAHNPQTKQTVTETHAQPIITRQPLINSINELTVADLSPFLFFVVN